MNKNLLKTSLFLLYISGLTATFGAQQQNPNAGGGDQQQDAQPADNNNRQNAFVKNILDSIKAKNKKTNVNKAQEKAMNALYGNGGSEVTEKMVGFAAKYYIAERILHDLGSSDNIRIRKPQNNDSAEAVSNRILNDYAYGINGKAKKVASNELLVGNETCGEKEFKKLIEEIGRNENEKEELRGLVKSVKGQKNMFKDLRVGNLGDDDPDSKGYVEAWFKKILEDQNQNKVVTKNPQTFGYANNIKKVPEPITKGVALLQKLEKDASQINNDRALKKKKLAKLDKFVYHLSELSKEGEQYINLKDKNNGNALVSNENKRLFKNIKENFQELLERSREAYRGDPNAKKLNEEREERGHTNDDYKIIYQFSLDQCLKLLYERSVTDRTNGVRLPKGVYVLDFDNGENLKSEVTALEQRIEYHKGEMKKRKTPTSISWSWRWLFHNAVPPLVDRFVAWIFKINVKQINQIVGIGNSKNEIERLEKHHGELRVYNAKEKAKADNVALIAKKSGINSVAVDAKSFEIKGEKPAKYKPGSNLEGKPLPQIVIVSIAWILVVWFAINYLINKYFEDDDYDYDYDDDDDDDYDDEGYEGDDEDDDDYYDDDEEEDYEEEEEEDYDDEEGEEGDYSDEGR